MAIDITKGIEPFEDHIDFSRNNPDRKPWGKGSADRIDLRSEYDPAPLPPEAPVAATPPPPETPTPQKFTHKLANGTVLEAASVEELASKIEKAIATPQPPPPMDFEDKPLYVPYEFKAKELTLQEQAEILNLWKENPQAAMRKLQEADLGAPAATIIKMFQDTQSIVRLKLEEEASVEFILDNVDTYNPTVANGRKLTAYLKEKGKPVTTRNLTVAFNQLVAAGDKNLLRKEEAPVESQEGLEEVPPPPVIVPSNQGRPETPPVGTVDVAKFAALSLEKQKEFFANLKRRA